MKIYKSSAGHYYIDNKIVPPGKYELIFSGEYITLLEFTTNIKLVNNVKLTSVQKEDDSYYSNLTEFLNNFGSFFVDAPGTGALTDRVTNLENITYEYEIYESINQTSGTLQVPEGSQIHLNQYEEGVDCLVVKLDSLGKPIDEVVRDISGTIVTATLDEAGNYVLSGTPTSYPVAIIYQILLHQINIPNIPINSIVSQLRLNEENLIKSYLSNGVISGLDLQINGDNTKFNILPGKAYFIDVYTTPTNPLFTEINFPGVTGVTPTYLTTNKTSYIAVDKNSNIFQSATPFTPVQRRDYIILGTVVHSNLSTINVVNDLPDVALGTTSQLNDLLDGLRNFNCNGNKFSANGSNLSINKSVGSLFKRGVNFRISSKNPHVKSMPALEAPNNIRHRLSNGTEYPDTNVIEKYYESSPGVRTPLPNGSFTIHRIVLFSSNLVRVQYGQKTYGTMALAKQSILTDAFTVEQNISENGLIRAYLIIAGRTTDLSNESDALFIETDKFGTTALGGTGGTTTLQQAYDNSTKPEITTSSERGSVTIQSHTNDGSSYII